MKHHPNPYLDSPSPRSRPRVRIEPKHEDGNHFRTKFAPKIEDIDGNGDGEGCATDPYMAPYLDNPSPRSRPRVHIEPKQEDVHHFQPKVAPKIEDIDGDGDGDGCASDPIDGDADVDDDMWEVDDQNNKDMDIDDLANRMGAPADHFDDTDSDTQHVSPSKKHDTSDAPAKKVKKKKRNGATQRKRKYEKAKQLVVDNVGKCAFIPALVDLVNLQNSRRYDVKKERQQINQLNRYIDAVVVQPGSSSSSQ